MQLNDAIVKRIYEICDEKSVNICIFVTNI